MKLNETVEMMNSDDFKERFKMDKKTIETLEKISNRLWWTTLWLALIVLFK